MLLLGGKGAANMILSYNLAKGNFWNTRARKNCGMCCLVLSTENSLQCPGSSDLSEVKQNFSNTALTETLENNRDN